MSRFVSAHIAAAKDEGEHDRRRIVLPLRAREVFLFVASGRGRGGQQTLDLPDDPLRVLLILERDHEELVALVGLQILPAGVISQSRAAKFCFPVLEAVSLYCARLAAVNFQLTP